MRFTTQLISPLGGRTLFSVLGALVCGGAAGAAAPADSTGRAYPVYVGVQAAALHFAGLGQTDANGRPLSYNGLMPVVGYQISRCTRLEAAVLWREKQRGP